MDFSKTFPPRCVGLAKTEDSLEPGNHGQPKTAPLVFRASKEDLISVRCAITSKSSLYAGQAG